MNKIFFATTFFSIILLQTNAQVNLGLKIGTNASKITGAGFDENYKFNYLAGVAASINLGNKWQVVPEVLFTQSTTTTSTQFSSFYSGAGASAQSNLRTNKLNTLALPVVLRKGSGSVKWEIGGQYAILMDNNKNLLQNGESAFKNGDFSAIGGVYLKLPAKLYANARYLIGLNNLNDITNNSTWRSQSIQLAVGFNF